MSATELGATPGPGNFPPHHPLIDTSEVAPPGMEHVVRALKKKPGIDNPFAVAWSMKKDSEADDATIDGAEEVSPPGYENVVKGLKGNPKVDNPWAVAWWMKGQGIEPHTKTKAKASEADGTPRVTGSIVEMEEAHETGRDRRARLKREAKEKRQSPPPLFGIPAMGLVAHEKIANYKAQPGDHPQERDEQGRYASESEDQARDDHGRFAGSGGGAPATDPSRRYPGPGSDASEPNTTWVKKSARPAPAAPPPTARFQGYEGLSEAMPATAMAPLLRGTATPTPLRTAPVAPNFPIQSFRSDVQRKEGIFASMHPSSGLQPKDVVNYRYAGDPKQACGVCVHYNPDGSCDKVIGMIRAIDTCDLWEQKTAQSSAMKALAQRLQQQQQPTPAPAPAPSPSPVPLPAPPAQPAPRGLSEAGTSEGVKKGWLVRKGQHIGKGGGNKVKEPAPSLLDKAVDYASKLYAKHGPGIKKAIADFMVTPEEHKKFHDEPHPSEGHLTPTGGYMWTPAHATEADVVALVTEMRPRLDAYLSVRLLESRLLEAGDWDEAKHPRDDKGRFGQGSGGAQVAGTDIAPKPNDPGEPVGPFADIEGESLVAGHEGPEASGGHRVETVEEAYKLLTENQKVILAKPRMVSTLLDKLAVEAQKARDSGGELDINLCNVSVEGSNIFCSENKGLSRIKMPQLSGKPRPGSDADKLPKNAKGEVDLGSLFREHLAGKGIKIDDTSIAASVLKASQNELDGEKVSGMMKAMEAGKIKPEPIFVTQDDYVVDGHHRWAATLGLDWKDDKTDIQMPVARVKAGIMEVLVLANKFTNSMGIEPAPMRAKKKAKESLSFETLRNRLLEGLRPPVPRVRATLVPA